MLCLLGVWLVGLLTGLWIADGSPGGPGLAGLLATAGLLLGAGFMVAAVFSYAALSTGGDRRAVIAPLYAADLAGGCLGSVAAGLVLVPVLGLLPTLGWGMGVAFLAVVLLPDD